VRRRRVGGEHEVLATRKASSRWRGASAVLVGAQAGFVTASNRPGCARSDRKRFARVPRGFQVAIVHTEDARTGRYRASELFKRVDFDERLHAQFASESDQLL